MPCWIDFQDKMEIVKGQLLLIYSLNLVTAPFAHMPNQVIDSA
jgi:hypothetical protein